MIGAIAGDIIGSIHEAKPIKTVDFPLFDRASRFTDDTVLTIATADVLLGVGDYADTYRRYARAYPDRGYGAGFRRWAESAGGPYGSYGNGSAMRVSPIGWACATLEETREEAARSARVSHNHPEGVRGAQAVASAVFLARRGAGKDTIREQIAGLDHYDLTRELKEIRPGYRFDVTCQGSVPEAIIAFLESEDYEQSVRNAVSLGGDADTMACIAGSIAEAHYRTIPQDVVAEVFRQLPEELATVVRRFYSRYVTSALAPGAA